MGWLNGKYREPGAGVPAPAPVQAETSKGNSPNDNNEHSKAVVPIRTREDGALMRGTGELARFMPVMDIEQAVQRREVIVQAMQRLMQEGVDYGKVPGSEKPMLLEPGADKLANLFGLTLTYEFAEKVEDWFGTGHNGEPFFYYQILAKVFRGEFLLAEGMGSCTSWEAKYRWRQSERSCPECGKENIRRSKDREEWYCWRKTGGCGATYDIADSRIIGQQVGRKPNPDIYDCVNTVLKMALKRSKVSGVRNGTSASEFFSQDMEDFTPPAEEFEIGDRRMNTREAAQAVAERKLRTGDLGNNHVSCKSMAEMAKSFEAIREAVGEVEYRAELERWGWAKFQDIRNALDSKDATARAQAKQKVIECYSHLVAIARKEGR